MTAITEVERVKYTDLKGVIRDGLSTFVRTGAALALVREGKLYREEYDTFEAFCQTEYGWSRQRAAQLIGASEVVQDLSTTVDKLPSNERHVRELSRVPEGERTEVWSKILEAAETLPDGDPIITTDLVSKVVDRHLQPPEPKRTTSKSTHASGTPGPKSKDTPKKKSKSESKVDWSRKQAEREAEERRAALEAKKEAEARAEMAFDDGDEAASEMHADEAHEAGDDGVATDSGVGSSAAAPDLARGAEPTVTAAPSSSPLSAGDSDQRLTYLRKAESALADASAFRALGQSAVQDALDTVRRVIEMIRQEDAA
jgi:hypothetical protein